MSKKLTAKIKNTIKELDYPRRRQLLTPEGGQALKLGSVEQEWLYKYVAEAEMGLGHGKEGSLHSINIPGYGTDLTDQVSSKNGKAITRKQLTDQRIYQRRNDVMNSAELVYESDMAVEGSEDDDLSASDQFDIALYQASLEQEEEGHHFLARYGHGNGVRESTPAIQVTFLSIISGKIHRLGIRGAREALNATYKSELLANPARKETLDKQLTEALGALPNWYNLETSFLINKRELELTSEEELSLEGLNKQDRANKEALIFNTKRKARQEKLKVTK